MEQKKADYKIWMITTDINPEKFLIGYSSKKTPLTKVLYLKQKINKNNFFNPSNKYYITVLKYYDDKTREHIKSLVYRHKRTEEDKIRINKGDDLKDDFLYYQNFNEYKDIEEQETVKNIESEIYNNNNNKQGLKISKTEAEEMIKKLINYNDKEDLIQLIDIQINKLIKHHKNKGNDVKINNELKQIQKKTEKMIKNDELEDKERMEQLKKRTIKKIVGGNYARKKLIN